MAQLVVKAARLFYDGPKGGGDSVQVDINAHNDSTTLNSYNRKLSGR